MSYCGNDCVSCSQICDCIQLSSSNGSILINKDGCRWSLNWNPDSFTVNSGLLFTEETRELCMEVNGQTTCVVIPDSDDEYLTLEESNLNIIKPDGTIVTTIDLSAIQITFAATSQSISITPGGPFGHTPNFEIDPSSDSGNVFILGTDGKPYVPETLVPPQTQTPITTNDSNTIDLIASGLNMHTLEADVKYRDTNSISLDDDTGGLNATLNIDPNSTADISITQYGLLVNNPTFNVNITPIQGLFFQKTVVGNTITFVPQFDYVYIASQVCPLCPPPDTPCNAPTVVISGITDGTFTVNVSPLALGDNYDISLDNGVSFPYTTINTTTFTLSNLPELTTYQVVVRLHCVLGGTVSTIEQDTTTLDCTDITNLTASITGTTANLTWTVPTLSTIQQPQYKLSTSGLYTNTATTTLGNISINGLLVNRIYDFRVNNSCHNPNTSISNNIQNISFSCPTLTTTGTSQTVISYSYPSLSGTSITNVKIDLLNNAGTTILQTQNKVPPLNSGTFTGLAAGTSYKVRLTLQAQGATQLFQSVCTANTVSTQVIPPTIYARLEYQDTSTGGCTGNNPANFIRVNAYWRTYSNIGGTIPYNLPTGTNAIIGYNRKRYQDNCVCGTGQTIILNNIISYNLTLTNGTNQTLVPSSQKYSLQDWYICDNIGSQCTTSNPGGVQCAFNLTNNEHYLDDNTFNSVGTTSVIILDTIII